MVEAEAVGQDEGRMEVEGSEEKEPISVGSYVKPDEDGGSQAEKDQAEEVDAEAEKEEGERAGDGENQGTEEQEVNFPYARIKRIMRKNPDKKKNYSRETIHAMTVCTVSKRFSRSWSLKAFLKGIVPGRNFQASAQLDYG